MVMGVWVSPQACNLTTWNVLRKWWQPLDDSSSVTRNRDPIHLNPLDNDQMWAHNTPCSTKSIFWPENNCEEQLHCGFDASNYNWCFCYIYFCWGVALGWLVPAHALQLWAVLDNINLRWSSLTMTTKKNWFWFDFIGKRVNANYMPLFRSCILTPMHATSIPACINRLWLRILWKPWHGIVSYQPWYGDCNSQFRSGTCHIYDKLCTTASWFDHFSLAQHAFHVCWRNVKLSHGI